jgi:hypothetical protein
MQSNPFAGGMFLDPRQDLLCDGVEALVEDGPINQVSDRPIRAQSTPSIGERGPAWMPGLTDVDLRLVLGAVDVERFGGMPLTRLPANGSLATRSIMSGGRFIKHAL